jgi:hypothetical protein
MNDCITIGIIMYIIGLLCCWTLLKVAAKGNDND